MYNGASLNVFYIIRGDEGIITATLEAKKFGVCSEFAAPPTACVATAVWHLGVSEPALEADKDRGLAKFTSVKTANRELRTESQVRTGIYAICVLRTQL